jgi:autotransporter-associated beta strand protein
VRVVDGSHRGDRRRGLGKEGGDTLTLARNNSHAGSATVADGILAGHIAKGADLAIGEDATRIGGVDSKGVSKATSRTLGVLEVAWTVRYTAGLTVSGGGREAFVHAAAAVPWNRCPRCRRRKVPRKGPCAYDRAAEA